MLFRGADHVVGAVELGNDLQILLAFQTASEHASAEDLVIDQEQPDAVGQTSLRGTVRALGKCVREEMSRTSVPDHEGAKLTPSRSTPHLYQIATRSRPRRPHAARSSAIGRPFPRASPRLAHPQPAPHHHPLPEATTIPAGIGTGVIVGRG
jgi:hypothetical protein